MPLRRLSIKSALHLANDAVTIMRQRNGKYIVRTCWGEDGTWRSQPEVRTEAKITQRRRRMFVALRMLGVDASVALGLSAAAETDRGWRKLVAEAMERLSLTTTK